MPDFNEKRHNFQIWISYSIFYLYSISKNDCEKNINVVLKGDSWSTFQGILRKNSGVFKAHIC